MIFMPCKILFVCLGNICRSPAAEAVFLNKIKHNRLEKKFVVDSAGTGGWHIGKLADSRMRKIALRRGIVIESRARQICLNDFQEFNLILTMDNSNLIDVNSLAKEAGVPYKSEIRSLLSFSKRTDFNEVPDPYYGGEKGFDEVLDILEAAIDDLLLELSVKL